MERILQKYLKRVSYYLLLKTRQKEQLISQIRIELVDRLEGHDISSYEELTAFLGEPETIAEELMEAIPFQNRAQLGKNHKKALKLILAVVLALLLLAAVACVFLALNQPGYYIVSTVT